MDVIKILMDGLYVLQPTSYPDKRGYFCESFNKKELDRYKLLSNFPLECQSVSKRGTLRGLHAQMKNAQTKIVRVPKGEIYDVQVDIRPNSKTFGKWNGLKLSDQNDLQIYIPAGFLHGFYVLSDTATVVYKTSHYYDPMDELTVAWNDPDINIGWPALPVHLSMKDASAKRFKEQF